MALDMPVEMRVETQKDPVDQTKCERGREDRQGPFARSDERNRRRQIRDVQAVKGDVVDEAETVDKSTGVKGRPRGPDAEEDQRVHANPVKRIRRADTEKKTRERVIIQLQGAGLFQRRGLHARSFVRLTSSCRLVS